MAIAQYYTCTWLVLIYMSFFPSSQLHKLIETANFYPFCESLTGYNHENWIMYVTKLNVFFSFSIFWFRFVPFRLLDFFFLFFIVFGERVFSTGRKVQFQLNLLLNLISMWSIVSVSILRDVLHRLYLNENIEDWVVHEHFLWVSFLASSSKIWRPESI